MLVEYVVLAGTRELEASGPDCRPCHVLCRQWLGQPLVPSTRQPEPSDKHGHSHEQRSHTEVHMTTSKSMITS